MAYLYVLDVILMIHDTLIFSSLVWNCDSLKKKKSATKEAQLVPIWIPTICRKTLGTKKWTYDTISFSETIGDLPLSENSRDDE